MTVTQVLTVTGAGVVPVLAAIAGAIRYLVRILASVERASACAEQAARQIGTHIEHSDAAHQAITDRLSEHHTALAVINTRLGGPP